MQLGYLMPEVQLHPSNLIMMQFLQSLVVVGAKHDYRVVVVAHHADARDEIRRLVASRSVDAFVLSDLQPGDSRVKLLCELAVPFACFGRTDPGLPQHWADIDNSAGEAAAVKHVLSQGFTRLGYVGYQPDNYWDIERENGFRAGLASHGIPGDGTGLLRVDHSTRAREKIRSFLRLARPDAVLTSSDTIAAIVYNAAAELDLRVGRDLAVTGFDGSIGAGLLHPRLTTVVIPVADVARRIVARVLRQLDHGPDAEPGEVVPAPLRPAGSTSPGADPEFDRS
jgi:DNA-binding LacI/PurR family transcriptional regulator